jgi:hypothetical protein
MNFHMCLNCYTFVCFHLGMAIKVAKIDVIFIEIFCKIKSWNLIHLPLLGRVMIVNYIMASTLWFFISVLGGIENVIRKCKTLL